MPSLISSVYCEPGSYSVSVPSDATHVVAQWAFDCGSNGGTVTGLTLGGASSFTILDNVPSVAATFKRNVGQATATISSTGTQTLSPSFSGVQSQGPQFVLHFLKDVAASSFVRDHDAAADESTNPISLTIDSATTDLVLAFDAKFGGQPGTMSGWTSRAGSAGYSSQGCRASSCDSPGASSTTFDAQGESWSAAAVISIKDVADVAAPVLSAPSGTATGPTQATIGVTSDTAPTTTPISYQILPAATAAPSAATIVGAPDGTISTGSAGALTKAITGLTTNTAVKVHFAQGASSNVVSSASFTPNTLASSGSPSAQSGTAGAAFTWAGATPDSLITNHGNGSGAWSIVSSAGFSVAPSINSTTGVLSGGTLAAAGSYAPQIRYTDSSTVPSAQTITFTLGLTVSASGGGVTFGGTIPGQTGVSGSAFSWSGPSLASYFTGTGTYAVLSGSLAALGLSLDTSTGVISGASPIAGTQNISVRKTASSGSPATADSNSFSVTISAGISESGTITLPPVADLRDGQEITVFSSLSVTALTISGNGATVNGAPASLAANGFFRLKYDLATTSWYRIG